MKFQRVPLQRSRSIPKYKIYRYDKYTGVYAKEIIEKDLQDGLTKINK